jgi:hypothetical protein
MAKAMHRHSKIGKVSNLGIFFAYQGATNGKMLCLQGSCVSGITGIAFKKH